VCDDGDHAVNAGVAVGAGGLRGAGRQASVGVADEGVAEVSDAAVVGGVPAAVLRAEARLLRDVRRSEHEVDAARVIRQLAGADSVVDDVEDGAVAQARAGGACVGRLAAEVDGAGDDRAPGVVGRVEQEVGRAADAAREVADDLLAGWRVGAVRLVPVAVPDEIDRRRRDERPAVVGDGRRDDARAAGRQRVADARAVAAVGLWAVIRQALRVNAVDDRAAVVLRVRGVEQLGGAEQADGGEHREGNADSSLHSYLLTRLCGSGREALNRLAPFEGERVGATDLPADGETPPNNTIRLPNGRAAGPPMSQ